MAFQLTIAVGAGCGLLPMGTGSPPRWGANDDVATSGVGSDLLVLPYLDMDEDLRFGRVCARELLGDTE